MQILWKTFAGFAVAASIYARAKAEEALSEPFVVMNEGSPGKRD
jgi:hypothetical protein